jgi:DNA mismatch repair protein MutL
MDRATRGAFSRAARPEEQAQPLFSPQDESTKTKSYPHVLGQYLDTYIVAAGEEGIFIIDQHNAHERVLFEKYKEIDAHKRWPQKIPLIPLLFDLSPSQVLSLEKNQSLLEETGFRVETMGGRTFVLNGYPDIFEPEAAQQAFLSLLEEMGEEEMEKRREKLLATLACRTAIKANEVLPRDKMDYLVEELFKTSNPSLCPHGRPVVIKVDKNQIEKGLKRSSF